MKEKLITPVSKKNKEHISRINSAVFFLTAFLFILILSGGTRSHAADIDSKIDGSVIAGSYDNRMTISITNPSSKIPIEGAKLEIEKEGRWFKNIRIQEDKAGPIAPKSTRRFMVLFDISPDAEINAIDRVVLRVTAIGALVDHPNQTIVVKIKKPEGSAADQPILHLVEVKWIPPGRRWKDDDIRHSPNQPGFSHHYHSAQGSGGSSLGFTRFPREIRLGTSFSIEVENLEFGRTLFPCSASIWEGSLATPNASLVISSHSRGMGGEFRGKTEVFRCPKGARGKVPHSYRALMRIKLSAEPTGRRESRGNTIFDYRLNTSVGEGGKAWGNGKTFSVSWKWLDDQNRADSSGLTFSLKSTANPTKGTVKLLYRPLEADKTVANIPPYVHPPGSEVGDTQGDETVGEKDQPDSQDASADTDEGGPGDRGRGDREKPIDPNTLDPKNQGVGSVIREWISVAEPPENATEGAKFRYEKWGRKVGKTADGGTISATGKPDYALSSPEETVWSMRQKLDSVNHCTVEEYVVAKLEGRSLDNCRGRYKASPSETVERLTGLTLSEAKSKLARAGLKPRLSAGKPAPRKRDEGTIASQDPAPGTKLRRGNSVKLEVYGPYSSEIAIPGVAGLSVKEVKVKLEEKGLEVRLSALGPAPSDELSFRVKETEPKEGTKVKPGTEVTVKVFGKYTAPLVTVPKIAGLSVKDAKSRLQEKGLKVRLSALGPAPSIDLSFKIKEAAPKAGTRVSQGTEVTVKVYGKYTQKLITVPRVEGLSLSDARNRLAGAGLKVSSRSAGSAPSQDKSDKVKTQKPAAGSKVKSGSNIELWVFSQYVEAERRVGGGTSGRSIEEICPCVDEQGRRYRMALGLDCGQAGSWRDYNCSDDIGQETSNNIGRWSGPARLVHGNKTINLNFAFSTERGGIAKGTISDRRDSLKLSGRVSGKKLTLSGSKEGAIYKFTGILSGRSAKGNFTITTRDIECITKNLMNNTDIPCPMTTYKGTWSATKK